MALWQARQVSLVMGDALGSVTETDSLFKQVSDTANGINFEVVAKEIEFAEPERTTEVVKLLGATSGNQNSELNENAPEDAEFTGTLILSPDADNKIDLDKFKLIASQSNAAGTGSFSGTYDVDVYNYGADSPTNGVAIAIKLVNSAAATTGDIAEVHFLMNDASIETLGGMSVDADGHAEQEIRVKCTAKNCFKQIVKVA